MTAEEFIFSNKTFHRVTRHVVFWTIYSFYFWLQSIAALDFKDIREFEPYRNALVNLLCFLPSCILSVYLFIYIFLPAFLEKKRYFLFGLSFILLYGLELYINRFFGELFLDNVTYQQVTKLYFITAWGLSTSNTFWAYTIAMLALGIKLSKNKYQQGKENLELIRKKSNAELQFQKARIHPSFLSGTLDNIYQQIINKPQNAPDMVLKLSEILSYTLYESDSELVPLEKELTVVRDSISLNRAKQNGLDIPLFTEGDLRNKYVVPMLILKLVQDTLKLLNRDKSGACRVILQVSTQNTLVSVKLDLYSIDKQTVIPADWNQIVQESHNRLNASFLAGEFKIQAVVNESESKTGLRITFPLFKNNKTIQNNIPQFDNKSYML